MKKLKESKCTEVLATLYGLYGDKQIQYTEENVRYNDNVYIMRDNRTNEIKIGKSNNPERRLKEIIRNRGQTVELLYWKETDEPFVLETKLHRYFKQYRTEGEWFNIPAKKAIYILERLT